ncbi:restriction endonuclease subunit S [Acinetobacter junii]|uniref:restriction endonuclease subunit S n=1 Tax=Acinetobacter junii TaxID=40215 RepID=UPI002448F1C5|nr:restriction endonuclease subunit S [Acinetobacter junii]MDH1376196.1 restriction endonuclease subunit S [Acinetobacter junii]
MKTDYKFVEYGRFSSEFEYSQLFQLCIEKNGVQTGPFGSQLHKEDYVAQGTPIITVEHLGDNRIIHIDTPFVTDDDKNRLQKYQMKEGDIIFSRVGSVDRRALVRKDEDGWLFSGRCLCVRVDKTKINPTYLSYFFGLESFKKYIRGIAVGATMPSINTKILSDVPVYYPKNLNQQKQIAKILSDLDDKIYLNNQINQTLESIAQAIFKSWFIDFDPVRAKIAAKQEGKDPELASMCAISGKSEAEIEQMAEDDFAELQATAALFPDELVESELGEVPKGWSVSKVDDILKRIKIKKRFKKNDVNEFGKTFVLEQGSNIILGFHDNEGSIPASKEEPVFIFGDHTCITKLMLSNFDVSENVIAVTGKERNSYWTYYAIRDLQKFQEYRRHWMELVSKQVVMADLNLTDYFAKKVKTLHEEIENFVHENLVLINLRDTLLPKLLSGEVDVSDLHGEGV